MDLAAFYDRHEKVALMFSGGKDSIACLQLVKPYLDRTIVAWVNTGAAFPEITEFMDGVRQLVPHFLEIKTDQPAAIERDGYPTDVLPVDYTHMGQVCTHERPIKLRTYMECCAENFWIPAEKTIRELGITGVIRGQRKDESRKGPLNSGESWEGVEYLFPIQSWSNKQVLEYLMEQGVQLDERLKMSHSSLDCWNCTAYLSDSGDKLKYMKQKHPEKYGEVVQILKRIDNAVSAEMKHMSKILEV